MKKNVILRSTGGELANQLWNYVSIYAYSLERGFVLENPSFFEYGNYFTVPAPNLFFKFFLFLPFTDYTERKQSFKRRLWRKLYGLYVDMIIAAHKKSVIVSDNDQNIPLYLPPTHGDEKLSELERSTNTIYFDGWLFRNPIGLEKYRKDIAGYFRPRPDIEQLVGIHIQKIRSKFTHVVGVHIRQGDYKTWRGGIYSIPQIRVRKILGEYLHETGHASSETCFVITSDGLIDASVFSDLNVSISRENAVHDLFLLSSTDIIIGSNSTFGAFASYYGNIPFIVMQNENIDWDYYREKTKFFENKFSTFVRY